MKRHVSARLVQITGWWLDRAMPAVTDEAKARRAAQVKERLEDGASHYDTDSLPFDYSFDVEDENLRGITLETAVRRRLLDEYIHEFMHDDFVLPIDCAMEWEETP